MAAIVLTTLALCPLAWWLGRQRARWAVLLGAWPLFASLWLVRRFRSALAGEVVQDKLEWIPSLGLSLSFRLDGLSGLFALLITGIGACVVTYSAHYFDGHAYSGRFQAMLFAFMAAMLGLVLADDGLLLFVFWELTGFLSYLLIGFQHEEAEARRAALQALLVTGAGGLSLLAGVVLLSQAVGSGSLSALASDAERLQAHPAYLPAVLCVLLAAFTKSAQFPFHFWLPAAMAAPTPVSAYLHSATMVKAGLYLVARMTPALGGTASWTVPIIAVAALTMLGGALRAVRESDLKAVLAYSTVSALGLILLLLGIGTPASVLAGLTYLVAHAAYKGALFLVAGIIEHETGTRDLNQLSGLRGSLPFTALAGALAAASMAGLPLSLGFLAKEQVYAAALQHSLAPGLLAAALVLSSAAMGTAGLLAGVAPFAGRQRAALAGTQQGSAGLWLNPLLLAVFGLSGAYAAWLAAPLGGAASSVTGAALFPDLSPWHGWGTPLALSAVTLALTGLGYFRRGALRRQRPARLGAAWLYEAALRGLDALSARLAPAMQDGPVRSYALTIIVTAGALIAASLFWTEAALVPRLLAVRAHEVLVVCLVMGAALLAARARSTMTAVLALGTAGYGVALMFLLYGAPDLAMTQFAVETLTAVIFVFTLWRFPAPGAPSSRLLALRDALIAVAFGGLVSLLTLAAATNPTNSRLRDFYSEAAPTLGHGRNIVNVMLVDFRALDTLGEITVLAAAAVGVTALLRLASAERQRQ